MRVWLALALSLASFLLAGAADLNMRDPLAYPNMLSAPIGKLLFGLIAQLVDRVHPREPCLAGSCYSAMRSC